jgi:hypothetical protein
MACILDDFTVLSDKAKDEDPRVTRMYLAFFRMMLEDFLLDPPPTLLHWKVPPHGFETHDLNDILRNLRSRQGKLFTRDRRRQWEHLMAMKNVGNVGSHVHLFKHWREKTLMHYLAGEAARKGTYFNSSHAPSLAAALRGCRELGVDIPSDVYAFWARVNPRAIEDAKSDLAADAPPLYPDDPEDADFAGSVSTADARADVEERLGRAEAARDEAEETLQYIQGLEHKQSHGAVLAEDEALSVGQKAAAEEAVTKARQNVAECQSELASLPVEGSGAA